MTSAKSSAMPTFFMTPSSLVNVMEDGPTNEVAVFGREGVVGLLSALVTREAFGRYVVQMGAPPRAYRSSA
jgi:hypothetical protein